MNPGEYKYTFSPEDIKEMVAEALEGKATLMQEDASRESLLGAANITRVNYLRWAAGELNEFASLVRSIPEFEMRPLEPFVIDQIETEEGLVDVIVEHFLTDAEIEELDDDDYIEAYLEAAEVAEAEDAQPELPFGEPVSKSRAKRIAAQTS